MKNKDVFLKIFIILTIISIIILALLGRKERVGYLSDFNLDIDNTLEINGLNLYKTKKLFTINNKLDKIAITSYIFSNDTITNYKYVFKIKYYSKVFRNSDIYGVYPNIDNILNNNSFIKEINCESGSPFGYLISTKILNVEKIDNINYTLKIKKLFLINIFIINILILLIYLTYKLIKNNKIVFNKNDNHRYNIKTIYYALFILLLALFVRIFWAYQQDAMYWDEWHSLTFLNKGLWDNSSYIKEYVDIKGFDILKDLTIDDSSIEDCVDDIIRLYKNTNDPFISNLYYTLLRLSFIGREVVDIKNIIVTGTILNSIFFIVSFIFLYKILKLIFEEKNDYIIFSLLIMSLSPISISFSMFLRPYQLQETFFVIITFFVIDTIYNNKYSIKNFIITTFIAGIGYLTLYSSMLFVLILSAMLFINYIVSFKQLQKNYFFKPLIEINSYKTIIYYAVSFISALFVSRLLYASFFHHFLMLIIEHQIR
ncbi:hypothetical protein [Brachyspira pilosicoli]|uniref:hypothetical protein n=1 Tax=Brachyspira pilosicoli TaxID=52584 RepID=UPI003005ECF7